MAFLGLLLFIKCRFYVYKYNFYNDSYTNFATKECLTNGMVAINQCLMGKQVYFIRISIFQRMLLGISILF